MDMDTVLAKLDSFFRSGSMEEAGSFLEEQYELASENGEDSLALGILNEQIGYYRVTTRYDKVPDVIARINALLEKLSLADTLTAGTSYLNIATVYRAMGQLREAEEYYLRTQNIYARTLEEDDYRVAGLCNNMSLLYLEQGACEKAVDSLKKALHVISRLPDAGIQTAVTHTNLGQAYCRLEDWNSAKKELDAAEKLFEEIDKNDEHYSGCAAAQGYLYLQLKDYGKAVTYYERALLNVYQSYGRTANFKSIQKDLQTAIRLQGEPEYTSMLDVCQAYYERYGKPMIHEQFAAYEDRIAVGLCGEGSECFGFEDAISLDHDCGPGFALWVTDEIYDKIGAQLQDAYEKLPKVFAGYIRTGTSTGAGRCGVCRIRDFFTRVLGGHPIPSTEAEWRTVEESALAAAVNGRVFTDPEGVFTAQRARLQAYYPQAVRREKLARELMYAAQTGQYNYGRAMARGEYVTAALALSEYMQSIMHVVYLLNRTYAPYYKWQHRMLNGLTILPEIGEALTAICDMPSQRDAWKDYGYNGNPNPNDRIAGAIELVAKRIVDTLQDMHLSESDDLYLERQAQEVLKHMRDNREQLIDEIVRFEWTEFDLVRNEGGRASCQNDWPTFSIMRKSQYMTWTDDMLQEYLWHIDHALKSGRNLITEKYGRMMESTAPEQYEKLKDSFPELSERRKQIQEEIIKIQVAWMEEFAAKYPGMAGNARSIHTSEDLPYNTSYETYLRGELGTYSEELMALYGQFIVNLSTQGRNLAFMTMENTAKLYGYKSLEEAESKMR